jgi:hypothetical protein
MNMVSVEARRGLGFLFIAIKLLARHLWWWGGLINILVSTMLIAKRR